jgi:uncharacterized iron-regulated membrane protein
MSSWQRWVRQPRTVLLRKISFQIHLWIGLAIGLYVVMLSVTGSALVFRREMDRSFNPRPTVEPGRQTLSKEELVGAALRQYPGFAIESVGDIQRRTPVISISLTNGTERKDRVFNAYTGEDLADSFPVESRILLWVVNLHDELLFSDRQWGLFWNGVGSILVTLLCVTGAIIWWPGVRSWSRGMKIKWGARWPRFNFDLHSAIGFWTFSLIAMWAISGIYLSMSTPVNAVVDWMYGPARSVTWADLALEWLARLHFGRWRNVWLEVVWVIIGLIPAVMFVTGGVMWWQRVLRPARARARRTAAVASGSGRKSPTLVQEPQGVE